MRSGRAPRCFSSACGAKFSDHVFVGGDFDRAEEYGACHQRSFADLRFLSDHRFRDDRSVRDNCALRPTNELRIEAPAEILAEGWIQVVPAKRRSMTSR